MSVLKHWLSWKIIRDSKQSFLLDLYIVCVNTLFGLENHHRFITVVLSWPIYCRVDTLIGLENNPRFIPIVLTWSTYCLCWYNDWVWKPSPCHNSGSYLIYILSCWYTDSVGEPSPFLTVVFTWCTFCLCYVDTLIRLKKHQSFITVVLTSSTYCHVIHWLGWGTIRVS